MFDVSYEVSLWDKEGMELWKKNRLGLGLTRRAW